MDATMHTSHCVANFCAHVVARLSAGCLRSCLNLDRPCLSFAGGAGGAGGAYRAPDGRSVGAGGPLVGVAIGISS